MEQGYGERVNVIKLYCVPKYPASIKDYNLNRILSLDGISDHTIGIDLAKIVLTNNPQAIIEKHFAIDHKTGVDAEWSMTPSELRELRRWVDVCQAVI